MPFNAYRRTHRHMRVHRRGAGASFRCGPRRRSYARSAFTGTTKNTIGGFKRGYAVSQYFPRNALTMKGANTFATTMWPLMERFHLEAMQLFVLTGSTGGVFGSVGKVFLNDIAHPWYNQTGPDHDPVGANQFATRYNKYRVDRCKIHIKIFDSTQPTSVLVIKPVPSQDTYSFGAEAPIYTMEKPGCDYVPGMDCYGFSNTSVNTNGQSPEKLYDFNVKVVEGMTALQWKANIDDYSATWGTSPANRIALDLAVGDFAGNNSPGMSCLVKVVWEGIAWERNTPNHS